MKHAAAALVLSFTLVGLGSHTSLPSGARVAANTAVAISPDRLTLEVGQFAPLTVVTADGEALQDVVLALTEPSVAEIDSDAVSQGASRHGVRGRAPGSTYLTASTSRGVARAAIKVVGRAW